jgi:hypothetical protein
MSDGCIKGLNVPPTLLSSILHGKTKILVTTCSARPSSAWIALQVSSATKLPFVKAFIYVEEAMTLEEARGRLSLQQHGTLPAPAPLEGATSTADARMVWVIGFVRCTNNIFFTGAVPTGAGLWEVHAPPPPPSVAALYDPHALP